MLNFKIAKLIIPITAFVINKRTKFYFIFNQLNNSVKNQNNKRQRSSESRSHHASMRQLDAKYIIAKPEACASSQ